MGEEENRALKGEEERFLVLLGRSFSLLAGGLGLGSYQGLFRPTPRQTSSPFWYTSGPLLLLHPSPFQ